MTMDHQLHLILSDQLSEDEIHRQLSPIGFVDCQAAHRRLIRLADIPGAMPVLVDLHAHLLVTLSQSADPDRALINLERFVKSADDGAAMLSYLADNPRAAEILTTLFACSQFLTEILLRNPSYLRLLADYRQLAQPKSLDQFCAEAQACTTGLPDSLPARDWAAEQLDALRRFQHWELLRIGACDLLDLFDLSAATQQLSRLADSLTRACLTIAVDMSSTSADGFVVIAMGKLGGNELNYSSDIDLLFIAEGNASGYHRLGESLIDGLACVTGEGFLYRVDMRLRPWGQVGPLVISADGYVDYLAMHARLWEKQALLKARVIAGDERVGKAFLKQIEPLLFRPKAKSIRTDVHAMRQRTEDYLRQRGRAWGEVKLGEGSIRDVEFVTQYLQLTNGAQHPQIRSRNTLDALQRLSRHGLLPAQEYRVLADGYTFLRTIEHYLQVMHYRQTHALPDDPIALGYLARRLGFEGEQAGKQFVTRYEQHRAAIRTIYLQHLGSDDMRTPRGEATSPPAPEVNRHLARMDPSYQSVFGDQEIRLHASLAENLDVEHLAEVRAAPMDGGQWRVTVVAYDYPGELSLICGLLFVHGFSIHDGNVFTYEPDPATAKKNEQEDARRKIVDVFTISPVRGQVSTDTWTHYTDELLALLRLMHDGQRREARGRLAKRVAAALQSVPETTTPLYPIEIEIDNAVSERYTVLNINTTDTVGFLYELTNALAFSRIYIARVSVDSVGSRVHDTLYVTDADGHKITLPDKQRELRAATVLIKHFTHLLPRSPNPEAALLHFRQFIAQLFQQPAWPSELASLERPEVLDALARLLGVSDFLWDDFLRMQHANLFPVVRDIDALDTAKTRDQLQEELEAELRPVHNGPQPPTDDRAPWRTVLNAFKDREMFRIDMRHILGHTKDFWTFSVELTDLAEVVVNSTYHLCHQDLRIAYGTPHTEDGSVSEMTVCALGKCGGRELGFASDIELMFIYEGNGRTSGPQKITTAEFYEKVVQTFVSAIKAKREGIFEIDLRLRPYGKSGSMAVSLEAFRRYFAPDGPAWAYERQALVKLRPIAGDPDLGRRVVGLRDEFVYTGEPFDVTAMHAMRERQIRHLVIGGTFNAKYSPGGLVDVEYLVEGLQIAHGNLEPGLRCTNIRDAMAALVQAGILSENDYVRLRKAHTFLRWLIDGLRMVRGNARDLTVPSPDSEAFAYLARRLRYGSNVAQLRDDLEYYATSVQEQSRRLLRETES
jgi:glutamate-ammonia-ligase adenylyltransferase